MVEANYEVVIERGGERWRWELRADGAIAASGPADSAENARCSGAFAAAAVSALIRIRRRDVCQAAAR